MCNCVAYLWPYLLLPLIYLIQLYSALFTFLLKPFVLTFYLTKTTSLKKLRVHIINVCIKWPATHPPCLLCHLDLSWPSSSWTWAPRLNIYIYKIIYIHNMYTNNILIISHHSMSCFASLYHQIYILLLYSMTYCDVILFDMVVIYHIVQ